MLSGALVPRRSTTAGVPGPRRNADECDAGWFAPVATRRRLVLRALGPFAEGSQCFPGGIPPDPRSPYAQGPLGPRTPVALCSGPLEDKEEPRPAMARQMLRVVRRVDLSAPPSRYSVLRNSMIATMSIPKPMAATIASDS